MAFCTSRRSRRALANLTVTLNVLLICLGVFILLAMSVVWIIFEEFTAFTDYTQQWIEFNFFIYYWDKLTVSRVYLSFIMIYGAVIILICGMQLYGMRKRNINLLHLAPLLLVFVAVITVLGGICWLIVSAVNYNEGFLATGGFIFERMRFKGNVWKDLIYREQSFRLVTENRVPRKAPILNIWVHQRERDFSCCGWDSYMDYARGFFVNLPESCCQRKHRVYGCGDNFMTVDRTAVINTRGCREVMYSWYRSGFIENIIMAIIGIGIAAYEFYLYTLNRAEYFKLLDDLDDMRKPMMNTTMSMSTLNSRGSANHMIHLGPHPRCPPPQRGHPGSIGGGSASGSFGPGGPGPNANPAGRANAPGEGAFLPAIIGVNGDNDSSQFIVTGSGRVPSNRSRLLNQSVPSDRMLIDENEQE